MVKAKGVSGTNLAIGVIACVAAVGMTGRATGSRSARGRMRMLSPTPRGFTSSPLGFVRGYVLEEVVDPGGAGRADPGTGLYHVTTNLPAVLADGRLRSRQDLRVAGRQGAGLGGGLRDEANDRVSVGVKLDRAIRTLQAVKAMARAVHGRCTPDMALMALMAANETPLKIVYEEVQAQAADARPKDYEDGDPWFEVVKQDMRDAESAVRRAKTGPELYDALSRWERRLGSFVDEVGWAGDVHCSSVIGFTEPAERFLRVQPGLVGLVKIAARRSASADAVAGECELRFRPEDTALVGVWEES